MWCPFYEERCLWAGKCNYIWNAIHSAGMRLVTQQARLLLCGQHLAPARGPGDGHCPSLSWSFPYTVVRSCSGAQRAGCGVGQNQEKAFELGQLGVQCGSQILFMSRDELSSLCMYFHFPSRAAGTSWVKSLCGACTWSPSRKGCRLVEAKCEEWLGILATLGQAV